MASSFYPTKRTIILTLLICTIIKIFSPNTIYSFIYLIQLGTLSIGGLLALNLVVLYIYVTYFISPTRIGQDSRNKTELEDFRPLRFTHKAIWSRIQQQRIKENNKASSCLIDGNQAISNTFNELVSYVIRDFIQSWFSNISTPNEVSFSLSVDHIIRSAADSLKHRLEQVDTMSFLLNRLIPRVTAHISEFRAAEVALRGRFLERSVTESYELDLLLASHYRGGKLHPALTTAAMTTKPTEVAYLRQLMDRLLPKLVDSDQIDCAPVRIIIREMATCALLQPIMTMLADPDFWNQTIDTQLGNVLREQKMVRQLREVLDRHSNDMDTLNNYIESDNSQLLDPNFSSSSKQSENSQRKIGPISQFSSTFLGMGTDDDVAWDDQDFDPEKSKRRQGYRSSRMGRRTFQEFLKIIEEEKNILDLKRVRNDVVTQIRKKKALIMDRDPEEVIDGEKVEDLIVYVNRLSVAKKRVDKRIATLSGEHIDFKTSASNFFGVGKQRSKQPPQSPGFSLHDILTNTTGLSYFMEFMDRRGDMVKLQFWLIVEGFRSSDNDGSKRDDQTFLQDVKMVYDMYFSANSPHRLIVTDHLTKDLYDSIQHCEQSIKTNQTEKNTEVFNDMRSRVYRIQQHVFWQLEKEHFPYFKRSDLYFKFLASTPTPDTNAPGRRSLDEPTVYRRSSSVGSKERHHRPVSHESVVSSHTTKQTQNELVSHTGIVIERTTSARMATKRTPWRATNSNETSNSDTEIDIREKKRPLSASENLLAPNEQKIDITASTSQTPRQKGHTRTISDNVSNGTSKFLLFGRVLGTANEWWNPAEILSSQKKLQPIKRNSIHGSIKSTDTEYPDTDEDLNKSVTTLDGLPQSPLPPPLPPTSSSHPSRNLIRRNTVDAVEAELQSIIGGNESSSSNNNDNDIDTSDNNNVDYHRKPTTPSPPNSTSSTSSLYRSSTLLLSGTKGNVKSGTADPVANSDTLTSWVSSVGDSKKLTQVIHDQWKNDKSTTKRNQTNGKNKKPVSNQQQQQQQQQQLTIDKTMDENTIDNIYLAPPGDLLLSDKVKKLSDDMDKLLQQESIVDELIKKAEIKGKTEELRILIKSKNMFRRELEQMQYQKSQYELQESENVLTPDRTKINITSSTIGTDQSGDFALYVIEIQQVGMDGNYASGWIVARRYSEFFELHQKLKTIYPNVKMIEFPAKWPLLKLQKSFVEARRINLERYLKKLLEHPDICQSEALRIFLSQQNIFVPGPSPPVQQQHPWSPSTFYQDTALTSFGFMPSLYGSDMKSNEDTVVSPKSSSSTQSILSIRSLTGQPSSQPQQQQQKYNNNGDLSNSIGSINELNKNKKPNGFMRHIYNTVAAGIDDMFVGPSMLDLITQRLGEQVMGFSADNNDANLPTNAEHSSSSLSPSHSSGPTSHYYQKSTSHHHEEEGLTAGDMNYESTQSTSVTPPIGSELKQVDMEGITKFTEPLCDLFIEMFELKEKNNWLRRQAVVIILQQILGGTIERKLRDTVKYLGSDSMIVFYLRKILDSLWPEGAKLTFKTPRKSDEKLHTKEEANRKLSTWLPDLLGNMVGRQNARRGARRLFSVLQNQRLNQHLVYILLDEVIAVLFPDLDETPNVKQQH
ncbi:PXA domain-containing protein [Cunninghamella echinulata]|nr:PXA domain-containing protein [Cunninghamella echinulata]